MKRLFGFKNPETVTLKVSSARQVLRVKCQKSQRRSDRSREPEEMPAATATESCSGEPACFATRALTFLAPRFPSFLRVCGNLRLYRDEITTYT